MSWEERKEKRHLRLIQGTLDIGLEEAGISILSRWRPFNEPPSLALGQHYLLIKYLISHYCWQVDETGAGWDLQNHSKQRPRGVNWCERRKHKQLGVAGAWYIWGSDGRWNLSAMLKGSDVILKVMGSYWKILSMGTTRSNLRLGKITLEAVQIRLKRMKQEAGKIIRKLFQ